MNSGQCIESKSEITRSLRILHLEDDANDAELIEAALLEEDIACNIIRVEKEEEFLAALSGRYDLILADYSLPSFDGLSALQIVKERLPEVPLIFVSGIMGEELAIESLKKGAKDYVLKHRLSRLPAVVRRAMEESKEQAARREAEKENERLRHQNALVLNSADEGIIGLDLDGHVTFINPSAAQMLGYEVHALTGKGHRIWHHSKADGSPYPEEDCPIYMASSMGVAQRVKDEVFWKKDGTSFRLFPPHSISPRYRALPSTPPEFQIP